MKIGLIGAGNIGATLARRFCALGHDVTIANSRGPDSLKELAEQSGATAGTVQDAVRDADVVIVTVPQKNVVDLPKDLFGGAKADLTVVDTGNYYPRERDGRIDAIENGLTESAWVAQQIGHPVIKSFNNIYAQHLMDKGAPKGTPKRIALPVAGDDSRAKSVVMKLVDELGFDAVDAGKIDESWRQQPGTPVYATDFDAAGVNEKLQEARKDRGPGWSGGADSPGTFESPK